MTDTRARAEMMVEDWYTMHDDIKANVAQRRELIGCIDRALADERRRTLEEAAEAVPTSWLDPLLTGEDGIGKNGAFFSCLDVEKVLRGVKKRIRAKAQAGPEEGKRE